eukprot:TRINITY_DN4138_c1_g1_i1.p1 TRINITY_DN4138_c1_g1~~TRINITY_DN4138_c1_g1_i1.p1  ORF type:complete len:216 (+),score=-19.19 TRINITY_DN4138_c1_g1_i1:158-805(+)
MVNQNQKYIPKLSIFEKCDYYLKIYYFRYQQGRYQIFTSLSREFSLLIYDTYRFKSSCIFKVYQWQIKTRSTYRNYPYLKNAIQLKKNTFISRLNYFKKITIYEKLKQIKGKKCGSAKIKDMNYQPRQMQILLSSKIFQNSDMDIHYVKFTQKSYKMKLKTKKPPIERLQRYRFKISQLQTKYREFNIFGQFNLIIKTQYIKIALLYTQQSMKSL